MIWMESGRGRWDTLSTVRSLTPDLKPLKVAAQIPSIASIFYLPFQVSRLLAQGIGATWWPIPIQWESLDLQLTWSKWIGNDIGHGFDPCRSQLTPFCPINPSQLLYVVSGIGWEKRNDSPQTVPTPGQWLWSAYSEHEEQQMGH